MNHLKGSETQIAKKVATETCDSERVNYLKYLLFQVCLSFSSTWFSHPPAIWVEKFFKQSSRLLLHVYGTPFSLCGPRVPPTTWI